MYGVRGKIGLIVPSINGVIENDFHRMAPSGVSVNTARVRGRKEAPPNEYSFSLVEGTIEATKSLVDIEVDIVVWGMTAGTSIKGPEFSHEIIKTMESVAKVPATTTSMAVVNAFNKMKLKKVAVATPYPKEYDEAVTNLFTANGIEVKNLVGGRLEIEQMTPEVAYKRAKMADTPEADSLFISCTALQAIDVIEDLERELFKPVLTSNQVTMWETLRIMKIGDPIDGFGSLLRKKRV